MRQLVIYHGGSCADGFTAAWAIWKKLGDDAIYIPANYGTDPPSVEQDDHVIIVDFSYPRDVMIKLHKSVQFLVLLDHHITAREDLLDLPYCHFDLKKSGAMLAWKYMHDGIPAKELVYYVMDRDLWQFILPGSREINQWLSCVPLTFKDWDEAVERLEEDQEACINDGRAMLRLQSSYFQQGHCLPIQQSYYQLTV